MSEPTIGERLLELKSRASLSLTTIARQAGYSGPSSVQAFFHPAYDPPGLDLGVARKLARSLVGRGDPEITEAELFSLLGVPAENTSRIMSRRNDLDTDIPVYETRRWNRENEDFNLPSGLALGFMMLNRSRPVRYYPRTTGLAWSDGAFAMHVVGTSMSPRFEDGEPLFLSGSREPAVDDDVLVSIMVSNRGPIALDTELIALGRVVGFEPYLSIKQYGVPYPKPIKLTSEQIKSVERISPWAEVCGLPYA